MSFFKYMNDEFSLPSHVFLWLFSMKISVEANQMPLVVFPSLCTIRHKVVEAGHALAAQPSPALMSLGEAGLLAVGPIEL